VKGDKGDKGRPVYLGDDGVSAGLIEGPPGPRGPIGLPGVKVLQNTVESITISSVCVDHPYCEALWSTIL